VWYENIFHHKIASKHQFKIKKLSNLINYANFKSMILLFKGMLHAYVQSILFNKYFPRNMLINLTRRVAGPCIIKLMYLFTYSIYIKLTFWNLISCYLN